MILLIAAIVFVALGYRHATAAPIVRRLTVHVPDYPAGAAATRIVLFSDIHAHGPDMPPARIATIVEQVNALRPDIVVLAGDFVGDNWIGAQYPVAAAIAPLARLRARLGVYAVLGNIPSRRCRTGSASATSPLSLRWVRSTIGCPATAREEPGHCRSRAVHG